MEELGNWLTLTFNLGWEGRVEKGEAGYRAISCPPTDRVLLDCLTLLPWPIFPNHHLHLTTLASGKSAGKETEMEEKIGLSSHLI